MINFDEITVRHRLTEERERLLELIAAQSASSPEPVGEEISGDGAPSELSGVSQNPADSATDPYEREHDRVVATSLAVSLEEVDAALDRLDGGAYGLCTECGRPIDPERLEALPAAAHCLLDSARMGELGGDFP